MELSPPALLDARHSLKGFDPGAPSLWKRLASPASSRQPGERRAPWTFVVCEGDQVMGYFSLASGLHQSRHGDVQLSAVHARSDRRDDLGAACRGPPAAGRGWGKALQAKAAKRVLAAGVIGVRGLVVQALNEAAAAFYSSLGFEASAGAPARPVSPWSACT